MHSIDRDGGARLQSRPIVWRADAHREMKLIEVDTTCENQHAENDRRDYCESFEDITP